MRNTVAAILHKDISMNIKSRRKFDFDAKLYKSNFQCLRYRPHGLIKITPANYCITLRKGNKAKLVLYESINVTIQK